MRAWIFPLAILFYSSISSAELNPLIKVRLETAAEKIEIDGVGIQIQGQKRNFEFVSIPQKQKFQIYRDMVQGKGIWRVVGPRISTIHTEPVLAIRARDLKSKGKSLPGQVVLIPKERKFDVIGVLPLENYLVGVIASEMPLSWPVETLKAQAIAARSYALVTMKERAKRHFHVESTILDQVFSHIGNGPDESPLVAKAKLAVKETEGMVLLSSTSKVLKAYYHADCGGKTSDARVVWGFGASTGSATDASCPSNPKAQWNLKMKAEALHVKLRQYFKKLQAGPLTVLNLIRPSTSDRVEKIQLGFESGESFVVSAQDFRAAIGFDKLRSTFFDIKKSEEDYQFIGQGFGHGVGLCQWGARHLGREGRSFSEILQHYYPRAQLLRTGQEPEVQIR